MTNNSDDMLGTSGETRQQNLAQQTSTLTSSSASSSAVTGEAAAKNSNTDNEQLIMDLVQETSSLSITNNSTPLYVIPQEELKTTQMTKFQEHIGQKYNIIIESYQDLYKWSIDNYLQFWEEFWHFSNLIYSKKFDQVLDKPARAMDNLPLEWFGGSLLNYAENLLRYDDDNRVAIYASGESFKQVKKCTFKDLKNKVKEFQRALKHIGVVKDDRVVGYMPNSIETVAAFLATASLGAIWSCASPDFGATSVIDRFKQIEPKAIFSVTSVAYNGKVHDNTGKLTEIINGLSDTLQVAIICPFLKDDLAADEIATIPKSVLLKDFLSRAATSTDNEELKFEQVSFNHPLCILYSSGTTGAPKCIVHSHGSSLIQHMKEHMLHGNMSRDDIMLYFTTTGWMMYNWLLTSLALGAAIVLYDGSPILPSINTLWNLVDELGVTMLGTSAKWLSVIEDKKSVPKETNKLSTLKWIYSTGSPLKPTSFDYVYNCIKKDVMLGSITGGTDIISLFCGHNINLPVYRGEIQCRQLGMAVECWNAQGRPVYDECGELVCVKPFPTMPIYFWHDADFKRYKASYFDKYPGVWAHGDFCMINSKTGGVVMYGRSDGVLNPNGVRFGSADIYNIVEQIEEIDDSLCVGQKNPNEPEEERVILFVQMKANQEYTPALVDKIKAKIRSSLSPRHVPAIILKIEEIPYTLNNKKVEVPVRRIIEGHKVIASSSLKNPKCLEFFETIEELKKW